MWTSSAHGVNIHTWTGEDCHFLSLTQGRLCLSSEAEALCLCILQTHTHDVVSSAHFLVCVSFCIKEPLSPKNSSFRVWDLSEKPKK